MHRVRKRGRKGGVRNRLNKSRFGTPLPKLLLGNVQSIRNKSDKLKANIQYLSEYRNSSLICLTETWLTDTDPNSTVDINGFTLLIMDRDKNYGKSKGGGVCMFINEKYCSPSHITVKHKMCTPDIELLGV